MNRAYIFPYGIEIDPSNVHQAIPVNLATHHDTLVRAIRALRSREGSESRIGSVDDAHRINRCSLQASRHLLEV